MPAKSKRQFKFMKAVEEGKITKKGLSKEEAKEFTKGVNPKSLPDRAKKRKKS